MSVPLKQISIYAGLITLSLLIFIISLLNQSAHQANLNLGLASPRPFLRQIHPVDIIVPTHGNFPLPDPGLLPSHPLYPLQMILDRLKLIAATNPEQHTRMLYEYSNIRMSAANQLIEQGEVDLALNTAIKGQAYLWQAISNSRHIPATLQPEWYNSLKQALLKHEEIIEKIRFVATDNRQSQADRLWRQLGDFRQQVSNLSGIPFNLPRPEDPLSPIPPSSSEPYM